MDIHLRIDKSLQERLRRLKLATEHHSNGKLVAHALAYYELLIEAMTRDATIICREKDGTEREIKFE